MAWIELIPGWVAAISVLVVALSGITALTPSKSDDKVVNMILKFMNILALNVGQNKNADD